jgi:hypothetical protein
VADDTYRLDDVITDKTGAATTVGGLLAAAFWFDLQPGQTEECDALRLHLLSAHCKLAAPLLTDDEALDQHRDEHYGPGGIRSHDLKSTDWDLTKCQNLFVDAQQEREAVRDWDSWDGKEEDDSAGAAFSAHVERINNPGQARVRPWTRAPRTYETRTRYTISILPPDDPWRRHHEIHVTDGACGRVDGHWYLEHSGYWADADGNWEPMSSSASSTHTFPRNAALDLARRLAPTLDVGGRTSLDVLNMPKEGRR